MKNSDYKNESFKRSKNIIFYKTVTFGFEKKEEKSLWILVTYKKENAFWNVEYYWFYQIWTCNAPTPSQMPVTAFNLLGVLCHNTSYSIMTRVSQHSTLAVSTCLYLDNNLAFKVKNTRLDVLTTYMWFEIEIALHSQRVAFCCSEKYFILYFYVMIKSASHLEDLKMKRF